jgi:hypothetical protein
MTIDRDKLLELLDDAMGRIDDDIKHANTGHMADLESKCRGHKNFCVMLRGYIRSGDKDFLKFFSSEEMQEKCK